MDKLFLVKLERTRAYWDYYKIIFGTICLAFIGLMLSSAVFFHAGAISLVASVGLTALFFLAILLLLAVMSLLIWNFENKHLHELLCEEDYDEAPQPAPRQPVEEEVEEEEHEIY